MKAGGVARIFILILAAFVFTTSCFSSDKVVSTVNMVNGDGTVLIYAGAQKGVINGDIFVVSRNGRTIGTVEVVDAQKMYCRGRITSVEPGETVKEMDAVELAERAPVALSAGPSESAIRNESPETVEGAGEVAAEQTVSVSGEAELETEDDEDPANVDDYCDLTDENFDRDGWEYISFKNKAQVATLCIYKGVGAVRAAAAVNKYRRDLREKVQAEENRVRAHRRANENTVLWGDIWIRDLNDEFRRRILPKLDEANSAAKTVLTNYSEKIDGMMKGIGGGAAGFETVTDELKTMHEYFSQSMKLVNSGSETLYGEETGEKMSEEEKAKAPKITLDERYYHLRRLLPEIKKSEGEKKPKCDVYFDDDLFYNQSVSYFLGDDECDWSGYESTDLTWSKNYWYLWREFRKKNDLN